MAPDPVTVAVDSEAYFALGKLFAAASNSIAAAVLKLATDLDGCGGMAGTDDAARDWAAKHDENVRHLLGFAARLGRAQDNMGALVHQCGANHEIAEHHVAGQGAAAPPAYPGGSECPYNDPPTVLGDNGPGIEGFMDLLSRIHVPIPNGDTDKLASASRSLNAFADSVSTAMASLNLMHNLGADDALGAGMPESEQIAAKNEAIMTAAPVLAQAARTIAASCEGYAAYLVNTRLKMGQAVTDAIQTAVALYFVATALAAETAGLSELLATAGAARKLKRAAEEVEEVIVQARPQAATTKSETPEVQPGAATGKLEAIADQAVKKLELDGNGGTREVEGLPSSREAKYQEYVARKLKKGETPKPREKWLRYVENLERNVQNGDKWEVVGKERFGYTEDKGYEAQWKDPVTGRTYDYGQPGHGVEMKSGRLDPEQMPKDDQFCAAGNKLDYHVGRNPRNSDLAWLESMKAKYPGQFNYTIGLE